MFQPQSSLHSNMVHVATGKDGACFRISPKLIHPLPAHSEEDAIKRFGKENIEVYHSYFKPLEFTVPERPDNECYIKLIVNKADNERVIGMHILGPNAGEVTQGYAVAIQYV